LRLLLQVSEVIVDVVAALTIGTGGAIVHLSDPQEEHAEILLKAKVNQLCCS
jgi:anthranilate/para-aminobenzoate synthase component I